MVVVVLVVVVVAEAAARPVAVHGDDDDDDIRFATASTAPTAPVTGPCACAAAAYSAGQDNPILFCSLWSSMQKSENGTLQARPKVSAIATMTSNYFFEAPLSGSCISESTFSCGGNRIFGALCSFWIALPLHVAACAEHRFSAPWVSCRPRRSRQVDR